ncbi:hypothetical protein DEV91_1542 [Phyllobacterium brassicacearum]|nr:hypothetical protein DEV91_1542 [Phyllobacterium brassicacearum]
MEWVSMSERELNRIVVLSEVIDGRHRPARLDGKPPFTSVWQAPFIGCYSRLSNSDFLAANS